MTHKRPTMASTKWGKAVLSLALWATMFGSPAFAAGWSSTSTGKWGARVLALVTVAASGSTTAATYVFLEPSGAVNVNTCPSYIDTANGLGPGISSVMFMMVHSSLTAISETQRAYLATLHVAVASGKEVLLYSNGCTSASSPGYNSIDGAWVRY